MSTYSSQNNLHYYKKRSSFVHFSVPRAFLIDPSCANITFSSESILFSKDLQTIHGKTK